LKTIVLVKFLLLITCVFPHIVTHALDEEKSDRLLLSLSEAENDSARILILSGLTEYWSDVNRDSCIKYAKKLIHKSLAAKNLRKAYLGYYYTITKFNESGLYDSALHYAFNGIIHYRDDSIYTMPGAVILSFIGEQYRAMAQYDNALSYLKDAKSKAENTRNPVVKSHILNRLASVYHEIKDYEPALLCADSSLAFAREANDSVLMLNNQIIIGTIYKDMGNNIQAMEYYKQALNGATNMSSPSAFSNLLNNMAISYYYLEEYRNAIEYAEKSYTISTDNDLKSLTVVSSELLAKTYAKTGAFEKAYEYCRNYEYTRHDLFYAERDRQISELNTRYETQKKEKELEIREVMIDKQDLQIRNNRFVIILFSIFLLFLILFSVIILVARNKLKIANQLLTGKNSRINDQKKEIESYANEMNKAYDKLRRLDEYKQAMTNMLVHDLKNPLNTLVNLDVFVSKDKSEIVNHSSKQMLNLILNLLDINKAEESALVLDRKTVDLFDILKASVMEVEYLNRQKNIQILIKCQEKYLISADWEILLRVFTNLLTNAIKFSPSNSTITIDGSITSGKHLKISVQDNGIGIPKEHHQKIFEKFSQLKIMKSGSIASTGLGLSFCKVAVEAHNWTIGVDSEPEKGASIWIRIPDIQIIESAHIAGESVPAEDIPESEYILSSVDLAKLEPYLEDLKKLNVYALSEVKCILARIEKDNPDQFIPWLNEVLKAAENLNEEKYVSLIKNIE